MDNAKQTAITFPDADPGMEQLAKEASALEETLKKEAAADGWGQLIHTFKTPFLFEDRTFLDLSFDWTSLTGADSLAIEDEIMLLTRKTVVTPKFSSEYLVGMAVRACTSQSAEGKPFDRRAMKALPLGVFQKICQSARNFLILSEL